MIRCNWCHEAICHTEATTLETLSRSQQRSGRSPVSHLSAASAHRTASAHKLMHAPEPRLSVLPCLALALLFTNRCSLVASPGLTSAHLR